MIVSNIKGDKMSYTRSEHIVINDPATDMDNAYYVVDKFISDAGIKGKNTLRLRLLSEEVLRLIRSITGISNTKFWLEGDSRVARIFLTGEGSVDKDRQKELISVSSSGENSERKGFFGTLVSMFSFDDSDESEWSLKDYQDELRRRRQEDPYSTKAWEDLERSIVANLADDIEVGISKGKVKMVVTKDLSESLATIGSKTPQKVTGATYINSSRKSDARFYDEADKHIGELGVSPKDAIHLKLLLEEVAGMLRAMTSEYEAMFWFEKYKDECCMKLTGKTTMDMNKKHDLIDVSSNRKNNAASGIMGKISDVIENGLLDYSEVSKLSQKYGGLSLNYGSMGIYGGTPDGMYPGVMWSLRDYRNSLTASSPEDEAQPIRDELERSIVASIAKDVLVSVKGDRIDMTIVYELQG